MQFWSLLEAHAKSNIYATIEHTIHTIQNSLTQNLIEYLPDIWIGPVRVMNKRLSEYFCRIYHNITWGGSQIVLRNI